MTKWMLFLVAALFCASSARAQTQGRLVKFGPNGTLVDAGITDDGNGQIDILPGTGGVSALVMGNYGQPSVLLLRVSANYAYMKFPGDYFNLENQSYQPVAWWESGGESYAYGPITVAGGTAETVQTVTTDYTVQSVDSIILCDTSTQTTVGITLPSTTDQAGRTFRVKKATSGGSCVLHAAAGDTFDFGGGTTLSIASKNATKLLVATPGVWALF